MSAGPGPTPPAPVVGPAVPTGRIAWALGFLAYIPFPIVNTLVTGIVQYVVGRAQRRHGGIAAANGIRAANWGLTQLSWLVLIAVAFVVALAFPEPDGSTGPAQIPVVVVAGAYVLIGGILQLVYTIVGMTQASRGRAVHLPVIPFLRMRPADEVVRPHAGAPAP